MSTYFYNRDRAYDMGDYIDRQLENRVLVIGNDQGAELYNSIYDFIDWASGFECDGFEMGVGEGLHIDAYVGGELLCRWDVNEVATRGILYLTGRRNDPYAAVDVLSDEMLSHPVYLY